jgi:4-amino-4-deoxy-L-arabinose transferase-like glycosyltransferase
MLGAVATATATSRRLRSRLAAVEALPIEVFAGLVVVAFVAISAWWVSVDTRMPDGDNAKHLTLAFGYADRIRSGSLLAPFWDYNQYAPLVHTIGAIAVLVFGSTIRTVILSENLVFVPVLALGCYGAGRVAFDRRVGVLAVVFAFAVPMIISLFHVFMLDGPGAAMVAVSVWLLLASRRFERLPYVAAAGIAVALGMYTKQTFPFFVLGLIAVMLARGAWRQWPHVLAFLGIVLVLVEPWYFLHYWDLRGQANGAFTGAQPFWYGNHPYPARWSASNFTWYFWSLVNTELFVPLALLALVGLIVLGVLWLRRREPDSYVPELVGGFVVAYIAVSFLTLDDPRYILPALVYLAVLGTGWIVYLRPPLQLAAAGVVLAIFVVNTVGIDFGYGKNVDVKLPHYSANPIGIGLFSVLSTNGYTNGKPDRSGVRPALTRLFARVHQQGFERIVFQPESLNNGGFNLDALWLVARDAGFRNVGYRPEDVNPNGVYVFRADPKQFPGAKPCFMSFDGTGIFLVNGPPGPHGKIFCPA